MSSVVFAHSARIDTPVDRLDVPAWMFQMTDADYPIVSSAHRALGTWRRGAQRGMVNVESIGGALMVQHYTEEASDESRIVMVSPRSSLYLLNAIRFTVGVRWTMWVAPGPDGTVFHCTVQMTMPAALLRVCDLLGMQRSVQHHVDEETDGYARDLERWARAAVQV